ncbi:MAG: GDSL-type esterase/lipase family protein [Thermoactinomyces sp.]
MPEPISYLAIGDSLTEGIGANSPNHHFVAQFFRYLRHSENCHVRNWGISGMTSTELLHFVQNPALQRLLPRLTHLTLTTGGCDFIRLYDQGELSLKEVLKSMRRVQENVRQILSLIRDKNPKLTVYLLGFYIPLPAYEYGIEQAKILVQTLNRVYTRLCRSFGVNLVDPYDCFLNRTDYFCDEVHPNQLGYDQLAQLFIQSVKQDSSSQQAL